MVVILTQGVFRTELNGGSNGHLLFDTDFGVEPKTVEAF